ncbi:MAG: DUF1015 domain-containing protein [Chloroflexi bacterium]|nr:DUF1015 domain-containing protein [Chloroflexota bacterium]
MAEIRAFNGVHYNQRLVKDLASVICPPYDIISPQLQQELYHRSEHNFVRLEHGRELPQDTATGNKYSRAAATLEQWLSQSILEIDKTPALYLHDHHFSYQGKKYRRRGMTVRVRLEEWDKKVVRPHEGTLARPKSDRVSLLWACQANTSPILALFEDRKKNISSLLASQARKKPMMDINDAGGESHKIWAIMQPDIIEQVSQEMASEPLYIADGHHRYESALTYQRERRSCSPSVSGNEAFNFVMMTLVDFSDKGLLILPPHRLVRGIPKATLDELRAKLQNFFDMEELPLSTPDVWQKVDDLLNSETNDVRLGLFGLNGENIVVLKLRDFTAASQMIPYFHCELYKRLDVSIADHVIMEELLGLMGGGEGTSIDYSYDRQNAITRVSEEEFQLAIILKPIKAELIKAIADAGDKMPKKSTYFYPKLPSGLVFYRLV